MSRRLLILLSVVCVAALGVTTVALAQSSSSSGHAKPTTQHVAKKHRHHPCPKHHPGDGRMTPGGRETSAPLT